MARTKAAIPRPANSFLHFRSTKIGELKKARGKDWNPRMADVSKEISAMWKEASKEEKAIYVAKALRTKEEHKKAHPDYRYRPRRRSKKAADAKTEDADSPSSLTSPLSSSTSSSASTPAPATPDTTMLAGGSSSSGDGFNFNFEEDFCLNHHVPSGVHATGLPRLAQIDGHSWPSQIAGWTDQPLLPSASTGIGMQNNIYSLPPKNEATSQGFFRNVYYQPHASYAPQQAFPPVAAGLQLPPGVVNQQASHQILPPSQAHIAAARAQPRAESLFDGLQNAELEAWNKEFAPLDAGFCDFLSAWNNVKALPAAAPSAPSVTTGATSASASLPPTAAYNFNVDAYHAEALPSQTQDPSLPSAPGFFDPSFSFAFNAPSGQQYHQLYDPLQALSPSAVWPEALNPFGIQM